jgi:hypothetical protein
MAPADTTAVLERLAGAWNAHDADADAAFSDLHVAVTDPIVSGNRSAQEWTVTGTNDGELQGMPATGKSATTYGCGIVEFGDDGLVRSGASYWNAAAPA